MLSHFNESVRRTVYFARYEASKLGLRVIDSDHLLLAISRQGDEAADQLLRRYELTPEQLRREVAGSVAATGPIATAADLPLSADCQRILDLASAEAERHAGPNLHGVCLILGTLRHGSCKAARLLGRYGLEPDRVCREIPALIQERDELSETRALPLVSKYGRDLTATAEHGGFDPLIGRRRELLQVIKILSRRLKNNPILVGESGVGKTAIVEGLAQRMVERRVPPALTDKRLIALDLSSIVAGTKYRGQFEERLQGILAELRRSRDRIVFIDEIHTLIGTGSAEGSLDAANILKPALSPRRDLLYRCHHRAGVPPAHREGSCPLAAFPGHRGRPRDPRGDASNSRRDPEMLRGLPPGLLHTRGLAGRGEAVGALHLRSLPAGQGDRRHR